MYQISTILRFCLFPQYLKKVTCQIMSLNVKSTRSDSDYDDRAPSNSGRIEYVGHSNPDIDMNMNYADKE